MKLTNEEIAKVFAMYIGSEVFDDYENRKTVLVGIRKNDIFIQFRSLVSSRDIDLNECKLLLTPLSKITDEHASEIVKILRIQEDEGGFDTSGIAIKNCLIKDGFNAIELFSFYGGVSDVYQYLISKGYAVPLWFGIDHWANGKTAIELEIALNLTLQP